MSADRSVSSDMPHDDRSMSSWQSPGTAADALLSTCQCWVDGWFSQPDPRLLGADLSQRRLVAAQWRAAAFLCQLSTGWAVAVRAWRALTGELSPRLVSLMRIRYGPPSTYLTMSEYLARSGPPGKFLAPSSEPLEKAALRVDDAVVRFIASSSPALTWLDLQGTNISDDALCEIALRCPRLHTLNLRGCHRALNDKGVGALSRLGSLEDLDLSNTRAPATGGGAMASEPAGVAPSAMASLASLASLTKLNLTGSDWWLSVHAVSTLAACTTLQALFLSTCNSVRDDALCAIATACVQITQLDLSNCRRVTDVGVAALAALPLLRHLELTNCPGATDDGLAALARTAPRSQLVHLGLRSASVSEAVLTELVGTCSALTNLNISKCSGATDATLAAIARSCPRLTVLDLKDSDECTDAGLIAIADGCAKLQELSCEGCTDALTDAAAAAILKGLKQLRSLQALGSDRLLSRAAQAALQGAVGAYNCLPVFAGVAGTSRLLRFSEQRAVWPA
jgi:hypothetical protein